MDICIVTLAGALLGTLIWQWFRGSTKRPGNVKVEVLVVPLIILLTLVIDLKFIFKMTGISTNMLLIGIVALCLGIVWVIFKSLQWAASAPGSEKRVKASKLNKENQKAEPIRFPEWKKSIVVLPFDNISPEEGQDYFCDGMTEEIITDLSFINDLRVISRSSAMMLKGSKKSIGDIAKELALDSGSLEAHFVLGFLNLIFHGKPKKSIHHFKKALAIFPDDPDVLFWLIAGYGTNWGKPKEARQSYNRLIKVDPFNLWRYSGFILDVMAEGQFDLPVDYLTKCVHREPQNPGVLFFSAQFLAYCNHLKEACTLVSENVQSDMKNVFNKLSLFVKYAIEGD